jgi:hypothetical protein
VQARPTKADNPHRDRASERLAGVGWRLRIELRRRWRPAPGWPPAPVGFVPDGDWSPDPSWPSAPQGWTGWRINRGSLIAAAVLGAATLFFAYALLGSVSDADRHSALSSRGVITTATVTTSSYDSGGGDPGGWTTDHVAYTDSSGQALTATVGHHYDDSQERASGQLKIIYDPAHPHTAMSVQDYESDSAAGYVVISIAAIVLFGLTAIGFLISALRFKISHSRPADLTQQPA